MGKSNTWWLLNKKYKLSEFGSRQMTFFYVLSSAIDKNYQIMSGRDRAVALWRTPVLHTEGLGLHLWHRLIGLGKDLCLISWTANWHC